MRSKILWGMVLLSALIFLASFAESGKMGLSPANTPPNQLIQGGCKQEPSYPDPDSIIITVFGQNITVMHVDAHYNCCYWITSEVSQVGNVINIYEHVSGTPCFCMCYFDLTTTIYNLNPGTYTINVYNADGTYVGGGTVTIGGRGCVRLRD